MVDFYNDTIYYRQIRNIQHTQYTKGYKIWLQAFHLLKNHAANLLANS